MTGAATSESLDEFRTRARGWLVENMPRIDPGNPPVPRPDEQSCWQRTRALQKRLHEGGFAGICFPRAYGGLGLDYGFQKVFDAEAADYEMPVLLNIPTFTVCCATILDMGTEEQKRSHIAAALRGDEVLVQMLSEPSGGSDLAGVITRADRRGDGWVINGAKTWTTYGFAADYGLCLARTNWDVPKHEGLTMFVIPLRHPGITLKRIKQVNGSTDFCEEFLDDVDLAEDAVLGEVDQGWAVASRQLFHERRSMGRGSEFASGAGFESAQAKVADYVELAEKTGQAGDARVREMIGRSLVHRAVDQQLSDYVYRAVSDGTLPPAAGTITRAFAAETHNLDNDTELAIAGAQAVVGDDSTMLDLGVRYLARQQANIGGGTTEMARNVIAERVLNFPREQAADRGVPFSQVRRNRIPGR